MNIFKLGTIKESTLIQTNPLKDYPKKLLPLNEELYPKAINFDVMKNISRQYFRNKKLKNGIMLMFLRFFL